jgi:subtilisin family serine protease
MLLPATAVDGRAVTLVSILPGGGVPASSRVVVGYTAGGFASAGSLEQQVGAERVAAIDQLRVDVLRVETGQLASTLMLLRNDPRVRYAQLDGVVRALRRPNDEFWPDQWSPVKTNAGKAWDLTTGSPQVVVAVIDTGVDQTQPDLRGKLLAGFDFVNGDTDANDDNGHGTAVAGIIAADSDNGIGVAGYCWQCRLLPVKVVGADGSGYDSTLANGMVWATDHGARVLNVSLGGPSDDLTVTAAAQYAQAHGALVVAAAGNDSSSTLQYPAALPNVVSVSASDQDDRLYSFSNSGAMLAAPGENTTTAPKGGYEFFIGTSSAAPVVSGVAGLAFSAAPSASPGQVEQALAASAVPIPGVAYGRVDAFGTVHTLNPLLTPAPESSAGEGSSRGSLGTTHRATKLIRGRLTRSRRTRRFTLDVGNGVLQATLRLRRRARPPALFRLLGPKRVPIASTRGARRLTLKAHVTRGAYRLLVHASVRRPLSFELAVSYQLETEG